MSDFYEERRKDKAAEAEARIKGRAAEREQDRADRLAEREQQRKDRAEAEERRRKDRAAAQRAAAQRKAERRARRAELCRKLGGEGDTVAALVVMACSIAPAFYFQVSALKAIPGLPLAIAVCLAVMLEAGAWVATVAGERAKREGRPAGRFRLAMWGCASVAAAINYSHAPASPHNWLAYVLAVASLGGVFFWELRGLGRHGGKAGRTRAERREAAAQRRHRIARRARFRDVHKRYRQILTAHPYGTVDTERAWAEAWQDVKGAPLAATAETIGRRVEAARSVEAVLADAGVTPEAAAVELFLADVFGTSPGDDGPATGRPESGPQNGPRGTGGGGVATAPAKPSQGRTALGRKGKQGTGRTAPKTPDKAPTAADLDRVRKLAEALGGADKLSARKVREVLGGGAQAYAVRVRDAVRAEQADR